MDDAIHFRETRCGFEYGAAKVTRACDWNGYVVIHVRTPHELLEITVSPKGQVMRTKQTKVKEDSNAE